MSCTIETTCDGCGAKRMSPREGWYSFTLFGPLAATGFDACSYECLPKAMQKAQAEANRALVVRRKA